VGEFAAFVMAACLLLEYGLAASATAIGWSDYLNNFLSNAFGYEILRTLRSPMIVSGANGVEFHPGHINLPPVLLVVLCCFLLVRGTKESATTNAVMVMIKLAILIFFCAIALRGFDINNFHPFFFNGKDFTGMAGVTAAAGTVFFSFIGIDTVATAGEEVRDPKRNVPMGILAALAIVTVGQEAGLAVILQNVTGQVWPALILSAGAVISVFSVTLVTIYGQTRILFAIARDGLVPKVFQTVHPKTLTPANNTILVSLAVGTVAGLVDSTFLWDMVSMGTLTAFMVVSIAVPVMRRREGPGPQEGFRVPFGPYVVPVLSVLACLYIMKDLSATTFRVFFIWMTVAVSTYFIYGIRNSKLNAAA